MSVHTDFWEQEDNPQKPDQEAGGWRQEHLPEYIAFCNYKGKTARHAAQTEKGGVCAAVHPITWQNA